MGSGESWVTRPILFAFIVREIDMTIDPRVDAVFIPVTDMDRAIAWYTSLLGLPRIGTSHGGLICDLPLAADDTRIILDGHVHARGETIHRQVPLVMFQADDLGDVLAFARRHGATVTEPDDIGTVTVLYLDDPDGNRICVKVANT